MYNIIPEFYEFEINAKLFANNMTRNRVYVVWNQEPKSKRINLFKKYNYSIMFSTADRGFEIIKTIIVFIYNTYT